MNLKNAAVTVLRGTGQVMLQNNSWSGLLMLAGIAISSWQACLAALAGNIISNLVAYCIFRAPEDDVRNGLYGFNGTLSGIAAWVFFGGYGLIAGPVLSTIFTVLFTRFRKPGYTAPFIISTWILLAVASLAGFPQTVQETEVTLSPAFFRAFSFNSGQVMLQGNSILTGLLFLAGIAVNDRRAAAYAIYGAALPLLAGLLPLNDYSGFNSGLWGYNAVLCAIAFAGPSWRDFIFATVAVSISVLLQWLGMSAGVTTLTAPFVIATWVTLAIKGLDR